MPYLAYTSWMPVIPRRLIWLVDSRRILKSFPAEVRHKLGFGLYQAQIGEKHESVKPMHGFKAPVWELRAEDPSGTYRAVYVVHLRKGVYVLHAFQKKAKVGIATPSRDIELIRSRLRLAHSLDVLEGI